MVDSERREECVVNVGSRRSSLSPPRQRLLALFREINFGRIEGLHIRGGEPELAAQTRIIRTVTFGRESGTSLASMTDDWELKRPMLELFEQFDAIGDGVIARLDVKAGLPCFMAVEEPNVGRWLDARSS